MALIKCSNCGQLVSDKARKCPKCGTEIHRIDVQNERNQSQTNSNDAEHEKNNMQPNTSFQQQDMGYQQPNMGYQQSPRIKSEYSMSFTDAISICLGNFSNFEERSRRKEYWYFMIFIYLINICIFLIQALIINSPGNHQEAPGRRQIC